MWPFKNKEKSRGIADDTSYISAKETTEEIEIQKMVTKLEEIFCKTSKEIIILCIGSDRSTGDSLGPMVGTLLKERNIHYPVYGTLKEPVHALNLKKVLKQIHENHDDPFILGIDACLGDESQIGYIIIKEGSFVPGNALNKVLPSVGDYHMKAIVNHLDHFSPTHSLNSTRLYTVLKLAEIMANIITLVAKDDHPTMREEMITRMLIDQPSS
jgi:putative sporulation protein YyaC